MNRLYKLSKTDYNFDGLKRMEKQLGQMIEEKYPDEFRRLVLEIAYQLKENTGSKTPRDTDRLYDGWEVGKIKKIGNEYVVEIVNNVDYAEFIEEGHRRRDGSFRKGEHMLELSMAEINNKLPKHLKSWIDDFISRNNL